MPMAGIGGGGGGFRLEGMPMAGIGVGWEGSWLEGMFMREGEAGRGGMGCSCRRGVLETREIRR